MSILTDDCLCSSIFIPDKEKFGIDTFRIQTFKLVLHSFELFSSIVLSFKIRMTAITLVTTARSFFHHFNWLSIVEGAVSGIGLSKIV